MMPFSMTLNPTKSEIFNCIFEVLSGSEPSIAARLNDWKYARLGAYHQGGTGGVYELILGEETFMIKLSSSADHLKHEVLANTIYKLLGVPVPDFVVVKNLPQHWARVLCKLSGKVVDKERICLISRKMEGRQLHEDDVKTVVSQLSNTFVLNAFLRNRDGMSFKNLIIDAHGTLWHVDNGSTLYKRALGAEDHEHINHVTDLITLRDADYSPLGRMVYGDISPASLQMQKQKLLASAKDIVELTHKLHRVLAFENFSRLYDVLTRRMISLAYDNFSALEFKGYYNERILKEAKAHMRAGVLCMTYVQDQCFVLLRQETQGIHHDKYNCIAGEAKESDLPLAVTAAKILQSSSEGLIEYSGDELQWRPFVEYINKICEIRIYLLQLPYVDVRTIQNLKWVKLSELDTGVHRIHPELLDIINTEAFHYFCREMKNYNDDLPPTLRIVRENAAQKALAHALKMSAIKRGLEGAKRESKLETKEYEAQVMEVDACLSERNLRHVSTDLRDIPDRRACVSAFLASEYSLQSGVHYDRAIINMFDAILQEECRQQARSLSTLYHSAPSHVVLIYELFSTLHALLSHQPQVTTRFRFAPPLLHLLPDLASFKSYFRFREDIHNYDRGYPEVGLSANLWLFGSFGHAKSASYDLFVRNQAGNEIAVFGEHGLLKRFLSYAGLKPFHVNLLHERLHQFSEEIERYGGCLYQICLPKDALEKYTYLAKIGGAELKIDGSSDVASFLQKANSGALDTEYQLHAQARIFLHPGFYQAAKIIKYRQQALPQDCLHKQRQLLASIARTVFLCLIQSRRLFYMQTNSEIVYRGLLPSLAGSSKAFAKEILAQITGYGEYYKALVFRLLFPGFKAEDAGQQALLSNTLCQAAKYGNISMVAKCLWLGYDVNAQDKDGMTPLMHAYLHARRADVCMLLLKHPDINVLIGNNDGKRIIYYTREEPQDEIIDEIERLDKLQSLRWELARAFLCSNPAKEINQKKLLPRAVELGLHDDALRCLFAGANVNRRLSGEKPYAIAKRLWPESRLFNTLNSWYTPDRSPFYKGLFSEKSKITNSLRSILGTRNATQKIIRAGLHFRVVSLNMLEALKDCLNAGVSVNSQDSSGNTLIVHAHKHFSWSCFLLLLEQDELDFSLRNFTGQTLDNLIEEPVIRERVFDAKVRQRKNAFREEEKEVKQVEASQSIMTYVDKHQDDFEEMSRCLVCAVKKGFPNIVKACLARGAKINYEVNNASTPLLFSSWKGHIDLSKLLVSHGARYSFSNDLWTPLSLAEAWLYSQLVEYFTSYDYPDREVIKQTILMGIDSEACENILWEMVFQGGDRQVMQLLELGVSANLEREQKTILECSLKNQKFKITALLLVYGSKPSAATARKIVADRMSVAGAIVSLFGGAAKISFQQASMMLDFLASLGIVQRANKEVDNVLKEIFMGEGSWQLCCFTVKSRVPNQIRKKLQRYADALVGRYPLLNDFQLNVDESQTALPVISFARARHELVIQVCLQRFIHDLYAFLVRYPRLVRQVAKVISTVMELKRNLYLADRREQVQKSIAEFQEQKDFPILRVPRRNHQFFLPSKGDFEAKQEAPTDLFASEEWQALHPAVQY